MSLSTKDWAWAGFSVWGKRGREWGSEKEKKASQNKEVPLVSSLQYGRPPCHTERIELRFLEAVSKHCVLRMIRMLVTPWVRKRYFLQFLHNMKLSPVSCQNTSSWRRLNWRKVFTTLRCFSALPSSSSTSPPILLHPKESWPVPLPSHNVKQKATNWTVEEWEKI